MGEGGGESHSLVYICTCIHLWRNLCISVIGTISEPAPNMQIATSDFFENLSTPSAPNIQIATSALAGSNFSPGYANNHFGDMWQPSAHAQEARGREMDNGEMCLLSKFCKFGRQTSTVVIK